MYIEAYRLAGYRVSYEEYTLAVFRRAREDNPSLTLDQAILYFEKAAPDVTLKVFAEAHGRTPDGYRNSYRIYYDG